MLTSLRDWGRKRSGLLSVIGALVIFFSWAITTTLADRYARLKQSIESAQATSHLYGTLHELRTRLNSLAIETVQSKQGGQASGIATARTGDQQLDSLRKEFDRTRLSSDQINEMMELALDASALSRATGGVSGTASEISAIIKEVDTIYTRAREMRKAAEDENNRISRGELQLPLTADSAIERYVKYIRQDAIPQVQRLFPRVVTASNAQRRESEVTLKGARERSDLSATIALALYVLGTILVLGGQYFDKIDLAPGIRIP